MATRGYTDAPQVNDRGALAPSSDGPSCSGSEQSGDAKDALRERKLTAAYRHDVFNLFALGLINSMNFWYLWSGEGFQVFWATTMLYFLADFAWILRDPLCVKSPRNILLHHCLSAVFALWPFWYPYVAPKMSYVMTVEVNTWLLTARRVVPSPAVEFLFYSTWFAIRCVFSPYLVWDFWLTYLEAAEASGNPLHPILIAPALQLGLCVFYAMWTKDLVAKMATKSHYL